MLLSFDATSSQTNVFVHGTEFAGSGCVELDEFVELVAPTMKDQKTQEQDLREAFKVFDKNGNLFWYLHSL